MGGLFPPDCSKALQKQGGKTFYQTFDYARILNLQY